MADDVAITAGSGTTIATDEVSGRHFQKVKLAFGADETATDVQTGAGLPVTPVGGSFGYETVDAAVSQDPVMIGGRASAAIPTAVDDGDAMWAWLDLNGRVYTATRATPRTLVHAQVAYSASQTAATVYTPASGKKLCVVHIVISATGAGTVKLFDGTDSSANSWSPILSLAANGGWDAHFSDEAPLVMSAADNVLKYTSGAGAAGSIWLHGWEE